MTIKTAMIAHAFDAIAIASCVGVASGCGLVAAILLALCGVPAMGVVAVMACTATLGAWFGWRVTHPRP